jgi:hypothetical protein
MKGPNAMNSNQKKCHKQNVNEFKSKEMPQKQRRKGTQNACSLGIACIANGIRTTSVPFLSGASFPITPNPGSVGDQFTTGPITNVRRRTRHPSVSH